MCQIQSVLIFLFIFLVFKLYFLRNYIFLTGHHHSLTIIIDIAELSTKKHLIGASTIWIIFLLYHCINAKAKEWAKPSLLVATFTTLSRLIVCQQLMYLLNAIPQEEKICCISFTYVKVFNKGFMAYLWHINHIRCYLPRLHTSST